MGRGSRKEREDRCEDRCNDGDCRDGRKTEFKYLVAECADVTDAQVTTLKAGAVTAESVETPLIQLLGEEGSNEDTLLTPQGIQTPTLSVTGSAQVDGILAARQLLAPEVISDSVKVADLRSDQAGGNIAIYEKGVFIKLLVALPNTNAREVIDNLPDGVFKTVVLQADKAQTQSLEVGKINGYDFDKLVMKVNKICKILQQCGCIPTPTPTPPCPTPKPLTCDSCDSWSSCSSSSSSSDSCSDSSDSSSSSSCSDHHKKKKRYN